MFFKWESAAFAIFLLNETSRSVWLEAPELSNIFFPHKAMIPAQKKTLNERQICTVAYSGFCVDESNAGECCPLT